MMHSSITRTIYNNSNTLGPLIQSDCSDFKFKEEVAGVTLTRTELLLAVGMYIIAVIFLVIIFEILKPSISAYLFGKN